MYDMVMEIGGKKEKEIGFIVFLGFFVMIIDR